VFTGQWRGDRLVNVDLMTLRRKNTAAGVGYGRRYANCGAWRTTALRAGAAGRALLQAASACSRYFWRTLPSAVLLGVVLWQAAVNYGGCRLVF